MSCRKDITFQARWHKFASKFISYISIIQVCQEPKALGIHYHKGYAI
uniref:Uncharacterized protein n=1 Tax=Rhizophora mucronata TaxID=61149 RepID=A0A2P2PEI7_RHIMU